MSGSQISFLNDRISFGSDLRGKDQFREEKRYQMITGRGSGLVSSNSWIDMFGYLITVEKDVCI